MSTVKAGPDGQQLLQLDDEQLITLVARGNRDAFDEVYRRFSKQIYNFVKKQVQDREAAEDITQEVFLRLYRAAAHFDPARQLSSYLYKIAVNETRRHFQKLAGTQVLSLNEPIGSDDANRERADAVADASVADEAAEGRLTTGYLRGLIDRLPHEQREVVLLKVYSERTFEEIARIVDAPLSTVLSRMRYAIQKLRRWMEEQGIEEDELRKG